MPFAGFDNFESCVAHMQSGKGGNHSVDSARRICGKLKHEQEKAGRDLTAAEVEIIVKAYGRK